MVLLKSFYRTRLDKRSPQAEQPDSLRRTNIFRVTVQQPARWAWMHGGGGGVGLDAAADWHIKNSPSSPTSLNVLASQHSN